MKILSNQTVKPLLERAQNSAVITNFKGKLFRLVENKHFIKLFIEQQKPQAMFTNVKELKFSEEVEVANLSEFVSNETEFTGPYVGGSNKFHEFINSKAVFKWCYTEKNGIVIIHPDLKHSVASGGANVITAGHGMLVKEGLISLNNDTGHYQTSLESLKQSSKPWNALGYKIEIKDQDSFDLRSLNKDSIDNRIDRMIDRIVLSKKGPPPPPPLS